MSSADLDGRLVLTLPDFIGAISYPIVEIPVLFDRVKGRIDQAYEGVIDDMVDTLADHETSRLYLGDDANQVFLSATVAILIDGIAPDQLPAVIRQLSVAEKVRIRVARDGDVLSVQLSADGQLISAARDVH